MNPLIDEADFDDYERQLRAFSSGELDPHRFVGIRLNLGIYAQRQERMCMVRAKLPGGRLSARQLRGFASAVRRYSGTDSVHITTRQDIQFHYIPLDKTVRLQRHLGAYGIATREAGGNTVRNITVCPLSGACPAERVNINPYIDSVAGYFVRHPLTAALPRKIKFSFSGCESDCANGLVHDLGVIATRNENGPGFRLLVGGGLGGRPKEAIVALPFVEEAELIPAIQAVLSVHDKYSDRKRKMRSRIKFLVDRFGESQFREKIQKEFKRTLSAYTPAESPLTKWRNPEPALAGFRPTLRAPSRQHQQDLNTLPVTVPNGELNVKQLQGLARLMQVEGLTELRTTQEQNITLFDVPKSRLGKIGVVLEALGLKQPRQGDRIVSCPGTATCALGITASRRIASRLNGGVEDLTVRINGCQNGCANAAISDIGLYGKGRRHHGRLVPSYGLQLGGDGSEGGGIGISGPDIPAIRVPTAVKLLQESYRENRIESETFTDWVRREGEQYFDQLLAHLIHVGPTELVFLTRDHGDSNLFKVESQGVGECAGATAPPAEKLLLDAQYERELAIAFAAKNKQADAGECLENQLLFSGRALLAVIGSDQDVVELNRLIPLLLEHHAGQQEAIKELEKINLDLERFRESLDELQLPLLVEKVSDWSYWVAQQVRLEQPMSAAAVTTA